jgi:hypothetical protein
MKSSYRYPSGERRPAGDWPSSSAISDAILGKSLIWSRELRLEALLMAKCNKGWARLAANLFMTLEIFVNSARAQIRPAISSSGEIFFGLKTAVL